MNTQIFESKIKRIQDGESPRVLDLFAGCGGISLGFKAAGFNIVGAIEIDEFAAASHALNFFGGDERHAKPVDITQMTPEDFAKEQGWSAIEYAVDVIVGGPPCQAFARVGRAKLREVAEHPEAFIHDPRGNLYLQYLNYVRKFKPVAILMENVPDMLNYGGHNLAEEVSETLEELGYDCHYTLLNAVHYGVPEMRERMFLVAFAKGVRAKSFFPNPTHYHMLPKGYEGSRQVALKTIAENGIISEEKSFVMPPVAEQGLTPAVSAEEALADLPAVLGHLTGKIKRGARNLAEEVPYRKELDGCSVYGRIMRTWPEYESDASVSGHVIRYQPRDFQIFERMKPGDQYPQAYRIATELFNQKLEEKRRNEQAFLEGSPEYEKLYKETVPPYDPEKFPNKWRKMEPDQPARTLMAHLGKDGYSHIHYDSMQKRTISVREAARLQSFPDGFKFSCSMNPAFKQIGNAVPPLLSKAIAENMMMQLRKV